MKDAYFSTSDYPTVVFLLAHDMRLAGIKRGERIQFFFGDREECETLTRELLFGDDSISARKLLAAAKDVKRIIHGSI